MNLNDGTGSVDLDDLLVMSEEETVVAGVFGLTFRVVYQLITTGTWTLETALFVGTRLVTKTPLLTFVSIYQLQFTKFNPFLAHWSSLMTCFHRYTSCDGGTWSVSTLTDFKIEQFSPSSPLSTVHWFNSVQTIRLETKSCRILPLT